MQIYRFICSYYSYYIICSILVASQMADGCIWLQKSLRWPTRRKWERHSEPVGLLAILMILHTILPSVSAIGQSGWFKSWSFILVLSPLGVPQGPETLQISHLLHILSSRPRRLTSSIQLIISRSSVHHGSESQQLLWLWLYITLLHQFSGQHHFLWAGGSLGYNPVFRMF